MDPLVDLIRLLRPQATLWTRVEASGRWGLAFHQHDDLLFCWVECGCCYLTRPGAEPLLLEKNDFCLVRTSTPFQLLSDRGLSDRGLSDRVIEATDSELVITGSGSLAKLGSKQQPDTVLRGGKFVFESANERLLTGLLPQLVHVAANAGTSERLRTLLAMNEAESITRAPGSDFVVTRLMDLVLVEILRDQAANPNQTQASLLAGLKDPVTAQALSAMHSQVERAWTTAELARLCGTSRSALAARFSRVLGLGPIEYLQQWRIALAKDELLRGTRRSGEIAFAIGFQSGSAFSTAFTRAVGCSPRQFAEAARNAGASK